MGLRKFLSDYRFLVPAAAATIALPSLGAYFDMSPTSFLILYGCGIAAIYVGAYLDSRRQPDINHQLKLILD